MSIQSRLGLFLIPLFASVAMGQPIETLEESSKQLDPAPAAEIAPDKPWAIELNIELNSAYFYRGYNVVDQGLILQPALEFDYTIFDNGRLSITPYIGTWNNLTSEELGPGSPSHWTEVDIYPGVRIGFSNFELDLYYNLLSYPSDSAGQQQEVAAVLAYDDAPLWESHPWFAAISPSFGTYFETQDLGDDECNTYFEFGIEPTFKPIEIGKVPLTLAIPLILGMSPDGYYLSDAGDDEFFGYASAGVKASVPLPSFSGVDCTLTGQATYLQLFADSVQVANNGDDNAVTFRLSMQFSY